jgi:hypothetical protein
MIHAVSSRPDETTSIGVNSNQRGSRCRSHPRP